MDRVSSLQHRSAQDALLLKMAIEGKDFQTARREVEEGGPEDASRPPRRPPESLSPGEWALEVDQVEFTHVAATLDSPQGTLTYEATRLTATHLEVRGQAPAAKPKDPLLLDLDGNGPSTTGADGARAFDLAGDGLQRPTSFAAGGDAFLALDRNGDGAIGSGLELFGDQHGAANGFEELRKFDTNQDGLIDRGDPVFGELRLLYTNGGVVPLASAGIQVIPLDYMGREHSLLNGDAVFGQASATAEGGRVVDVYALGLRTFDQMA